MRILLRAIFIFMFFFSAQYCHAFDWISLHDKADNLSISEALNNMESEPDSLEKIYVLVTDEYAGRDGASQGLADITPEANAVVTNGNGNQFVILPPMDETIGELDTIDIITGGHKGSLKPDGSIEMEIAGIMGATCELGYSNLTTRLR